MELCVVFGHVVTVQVQEMFRLRAKCFDFYGDFPKHWDGLGPILKDVKAAIDGGEPCD